MVIQKKEKTSLTSRQAKEKKEPKEKKVKEDKFEIKIEEMTEKGVHLGHKISKLHPKMADFVVGIRNTVHIIDLKKTATCLKKALNFISELSEKGEKMLLVGTKPPLRDLVEETARDCNLPYVSCRWLGGTFSNFKVISKRAKYYNDLKKEKTEGGFDKFSKKERQQKEKELKELEKKFEGIKDLQELPKAVFICDVKTDKLALKEAVMKGVKVIAIVDTNVDPSLVDYPIPANDDAISSVKYILEKVKEVIKKSKIQNPNAK